MTTYMSRQEFDSLKTSDKDINEWLETVKKLGGRLPKVEERKFLVRTWLWKVKEVTKYSMYWDCYSDGGTEVQVHNFCADDDWSINTYVPKSAVVNFLIGYACGLEKKP